MNWEESKACTPLKRDFIHAWFAEEDRFFLTGGSALGLFYLDHRKSYDLDFFTSAPIDSQILRNQVIRLASAIGAECKSVQSSPDFHRYRLTRNDERELLDFVMDRVPQLDKEKTRFGAVQVDTIREILANKLATLVGRSEIKDVVDLYFLEKAGFDLVSALPDAQTKEGGLEPAVLSMMLNGLKIENEPPWMLQPIDLEDLNAFIFRLRQALVALDLP
jgi:hypothetical protein